MSVRCGHKIELELASVSTLRSLLEGSLRQTIGNRVEQWLVVGLPASKGVESNLVLVEIDFGADESMRPLGIDREAATEELNLSGVVGAS